MAAERIQITLEVQGMTCDGCASHVEKALRGVAGVYDAKVPSWRAARATVVAGADVADETLARTIEKAGYRAQVRERRPVRAGQMRPIVGAIVTAVAGPSILVRCLIPACLPATRRTAG